MPKQKVNKATKKRIKVSKNGKLLRGRPGRRHLLSVRTTKRKRHLRKGGEIAKVDVFKIKKLLCLE
ncbi:MAG TPA: 50S ribosomal protein L35 [Planctomycetota bacterium]|nr:50S ribosomal protein L35 [Planctomycetota bacterium]